MLKVQDHTPYNLISNGLGKQAAGGTMQATLPTTVTVGFQPLSIVSNKNITYIETIIMETWEYLKQIQLQTNKMLSSGYSRDFSNSKTFLCVDPGYNWNVNEKYDVILVIKWK